MEMLFPDFLLLILVILFGGLTCIQLEECVHHLLVVILRLCPELQISFARFSDSVDTPGWSCLRGVPPGMHHPVFLHLLHQFIAVGTPLPQHQENNGNEPVPGPCVSCHIAWLFHSILLSHIAPICI